MLASLNDEPAEGPLMHLLVESMAPWYTILDGLPQHPTGPSPGEPKRKDLSDTRPSQHPRAVRQRKPLSVRIDREIRP